MHWMAALKLGIVNCLKDYVGLCRRIFPLCEVSGVTMNVSFVSRTSAGRSIQRGANNISQPFQSFLINYF